MRAIRYDQYGQLARLVEVPEPTCPDDGAVVQVAASGICRSDWHAWQGHDPVPLPMIPGHEFAGVVVRVGSQVQHVGVGERVTAPFAQGCGRCSVCLAGNTNTCPHQTQPGFTHDGSFAEQVVIQHADTNAVKLPDGLDPVAAAALGCRFATAYRAVVGLGRIEPGQWLAVFGCGGVGLSAVMIAHTLGARVIAVDVAPAALARAAQLGAEVTVTTDPSSSSDVVSTVLAATDGGVHLSLDALGSSEVLIAALACLRPGGRHTQVGLLLDGQAQVPIPMDRVIAQELQILGVHGLPASDYPGLLELAAGLDLGALVTDVIGFEQVGEALAEMPDSRGRVTVLVPDR